MGRLMVAPLYGPDPNVYDIDGVESYSAETYPGTLYLKYPKKHESVIKVRMHKYVKDMKDRRHQRIRTLNEELQSYRRGHIPPHVQARIDVEIAESKKPISPRLALFIGSRVPYTPPTIPELIRQTQYAINELKSQFAEPQVTFLER